MRILLEYSYCLLDVLEISLGRLVLRLQDLLRRLSSLRLRLGLDVSKELRVPSQDLIVQILNQLVVPHQVQVQDHLLVQPSVQEVEVLPAPWVFFFNQQGAVHKLLKNAQQIPRSHLAQFLYGSLSWIVTLGSLICSSKVQSSCMSASWLKAMAKFSSSTYETHGKASIPVSQRAAE